MTQSLTSIKKRATNCMVDLHPPVSMDRREIPLPGTGATLCVDHNMVRAAISSFNNGSSAGPDGLRAQHFKDMLSTSGAGDSLLESVTDFINLMLAGRVPERIRPILYGGRLTALKKKMAVWSKCEIIGISDFSRAPVESGGHSSEWKLLSCRLLAGISTAHGRYISSH